MVVMLSASLAATRGQALFEGPTDLIPPDVENMYEKGLDFLVKSQKPDGSWADAMGSQPAVVALSVLSILAHGDDPNSGPYSRAVKRGLDFILSQQNKTSGYIGSSMYNHGFSTLALAESYGAVDDPRLGPALQEAVKLILNSQSGNPFGAWRYSPTSRDADTTVSGAQLVALFAARNAGMGVPEEAMQKALRFYLNTQSGDGGFGYTGPGGSNGPRTAIGALVFALAKKKSTDQFKAAMGFLNQGNASGGEYYHYFLYYASQAYFQASTELWNEWNRVNLKVLLTTQNEDGSWTSNYGATFGTACSLLSVALNYRYLPIYER
jgi:Prenyltransferase and squalene oxidase repeat